MELEGVVDLHLHTAPDVRQRSVDDLGVARAAVERRMAGVLLKNHLLPTADRAALARLHLPGAPIYGGVVLNASVGGLNPQAVEAAAAFGGRAVWLPTYSAGNHLRHERGAPDARGPDDGIAMLDARGHISAALGTVLEVVAARDLLLCTGHISAAEVMVVVPAARALGVRRMLVQHCEHSVTGLSLDQQRTLAAQGAFLERVFAQPEDGRYTRNAPANAAAIRALGAESTVVASDLGQPENPTWPDGLAEYMTELAMAGIGEPELDVMCRRNPALLLGLDG